MAASLGLLEAPAPSISASDLARRWQRGPLAKISTGWSASCGPPSQPMGQESSSSPPCKPELAVQPVEGCGRIGTPDHHPPALLQARVAGATASVSAGPRAGEMVEHHNPHMETPRLTQSLPVLPDLSVDKSGRACLPLTGALPRQPQACAPRFPWPCPFPTSLGLRLAPPANCPVGCPLRQPPFRAGSWASALALLEPVADQPVQRHDSPAGGPFRRERGFGLQKRGARRCRGGTMAPRASRNAAGTAPP